MTTENINYPVLTLTEVSRSLSADTHKNADYTVPGVEVKIGHSIADALQSRLQRLKRVSPDFKTRSLERGWSAIYRRA